MIHTQMTSNKIVLSLNKLLKKMEKRKKNSKRMSNRLAILIHLVCKNNKVLSNLIYFRSKDLPKILMLEEILVECVQNSMSNRLLVKVSLIEMANMPQPILIIPESKDKKVKAKDCLNLLDVDQDLV